MIYMVRAGGIIGAVAGVYLGFNIGATVMEYLILILLWTVIGMAAAWALRKWLFRNLGI
jgi:uncharacterized membrane protein